MKPVLKSILVLSLLGATASQAANDTACWNRDLERMDFYMNPPEGGDSAFFTGTVTNSASTNVTLVYPTPSTLAAFTQKLYRIRVDLGGATPTGCTNAYMNNLT